MSTGGASTSCQSRLASRLAMMVPAVPAPRITMRFIGATPASSSDEANIATPTYGHMGISRKTSSWKGEETFDPISWQLDRPGRSWSRRNAMTDSSFTLSLTFQQGYAFTVDFGL